MRKLKMLILFILPALTLSGGNWPVTKKDPDTGKDKSDLLPRNKAVHVMDVWMRDPFITLGPDKHYYLSCTRRWNSPDVSAGLEAWRSKDLLTWESLGCLWSLGDSGWMTEPLSNAAKKFERDPHLWAPEVYFMDGRWVVVYTTSLRCSDLLTSKGPTLERPFEEPIGETFGHKHDPSIFMDDDGSKWLIWGCTKIAPLKSDLSGFAGPERIIGPSNRKMGHEGCFILKVHGKYVLFGTAWSTDKMRRGSYNLYYCIADWIEGPYGPRKFAGRFLGHGTIFNDKQGQWWCTAFLNGDYVSPEHVAQHGISELKAESANRQGLTLVPIDILIENGELIVKSLDPLYAIPGDDEVQDF